jgi:hypothetical protein
VPTFNTTAAIYLSFFDPTSPANILDNISRLRAPLLWVAGTADRSQTGAGDAFRLAPANPLNRYITVEARARARGHQFGEHVDRHARAARWPCGCRKTAIRAFR